MTGDVDMADHVVSQPEIKDYSETVVTADSGANYEVNLTNGNVLELTLTDNCILSFSNPPASGKAGSVTLILHQDGTGNRTVTWPDSVTWSSGTAPTLTTTASAVDIIQLFSTDGGTTWRGFLAGNNLS